MTIAAAQPRLLDPPRHAAYCPAAHCARACGAGDCECLPCRCPACRRRSRRAGRAVLRPDRLPARQAPQLSLISSLPERSHS